MHACDACLCRGKIKLSHFNKFFPFKTILFYKINPQKSIPTRQHTDHQIYGKICQKIITV
ncbi:hypothetical protein EJK50_0431 [Moraxella catarrhalis]|nr:hypothetical protein EJK50_0431 [Moraxella catarrhalis]